MEDSMKRFSNKAYLQQVAAQQPPELAFPLEQPDRWPAWRQALRQRVSDLLGGIPPAPSLAPSLSNRHVEVLERREEAEYVRERIVIRGRDGTEIPAFLFTPATVGGESRGPAVLCLHGHGRGKDDVAGELGSGTAEERAANRAGIEQSNYDFARQFARRGFVVLAPDARGFGERADGSEEGCYIPGVISLILGLPITGQRLRDDMAALDHLSAHPLVDSGRIGCVGLSEGGKRTLYLAAMDDRVRAAVISGYWTTLRGEIRAWSNFIRWDICNYVPGLLRYADYTDLAALIAPRPVLIESAVDDDLYDWPSVESALNQLAAIYAAHGALERLDSDVFTGGHRWSGRKSYAWMERWL